MDDITKLVITLLLQSSSELSLRCRLMAALARKAAVARPTDFHQLLQALKDRGTLLRVYTQNIDALELKASLTMSSHQDPDKTPVRCLPLHGTLQYMRCQCCCYLTFLELHYHELEAGNLPECPRCRLHMDRRREMGETTKAIPRMRANVVLYGEAHPNEDMIVEMQNKDVGWARGDGQVDLLLVVGTSLKDAGVAKGVRMFSKALRQGVKTTYPKTIYLDLHQTARTGWEETFDVRIKADCQAITKILLDEMKDKNNNITRGDLQKREEHRDAKRRYAESRLDPQPSWRWWSR